MGDTQVYETRSGDSVSEYTMVVKNVEPTDGRLKVTGRARYAAEFPVSSVVHAVLVQSTIGAGTIIGFDVDAAHAMPALFTSTSILP